jgi:ABC-2 type transport system ATP-binding protein
MEDNMLKIQNLSKRYEDGKLALDNLNLHIERGSIFVLLGANAAGKSTTINLICGFIPPTSGRIFINTIDALKEPLKCRSEIAYVSENVMLYENFSGFQNLEFFSQLSGKRHSKSYLENLLRDFGLQETYIHKPVSIYSKGMRQKTGIAIAIVKDANLILLDEPFAGLDPKAAYDFQDILSRLKEVQQKTIFMSTHNIFRARDLADSVGIMKDGRLVLTRTSEELEYENLEKLYMDYMEGRMGE